MPTPAFPVLFGGGIPRWAIGADLATDYTIQRDYAPIRGMFPPGVDTHAQTIYASTPSGVYQPFAANVPVITGLGLQTVPTRTNLFLNSFSVATQTVTVANGTVYTVSITGSGSITLSGAGTGTVVAGSPVTFTAGSTSLTCTVSGSPSTCNVEAGGFATSPIQTAGASATVNGNQQVLSGLGSQLATGVAGLLQFRNLQPGVAGGFASLLSVSDGTSNNTPLHLYRNQTGFFFCDGRAAGVAQFNINVPPTQALDQLLTFVFCVAGSGTGYAKVQMVGQSDIAADTSVTWPAVDRVNIGVGGSGGTPGYQFARKLALRFLRASDDPTTVFAQMFAQAQLAAATP